MQTAVIKVDWIRLVISGIYYVIFNCGIPCLLIRLGACLYMNDLRDNSFSYFQRLSF